MKSPANSGKKNLSSCSCEFVKINYNSIAPVLIWKHLVRPLGDFYNFFFFKCKNRYRKVFNNLERTGLFLDRLAFTQRSSTFNKLKIAVTDGFRISLSASDSCTFYLCHSEVARWTPFAHQMVKCRGQGTIISQYQPQYVWYCARKKNKKYDS